MVTTYLGPNNNELYGLLVMSNTFGLALRGERQRRIVGSLVGARCGSMDCPQLWVGRSTIWRQKRLLPYALSGWFVMARGRLLLLVGPRPRPLGERS
jgi:hypothetical protein